MWILYDFFVCLRTRRSLLGPFPNFLRHLPWTSQACHCVTFPTGASMHPVTLCQPLAHVKKHLFIWYILYTNHWPIMSAALSPGSLGGTFTPINLQFIKLDNLGWGDSNNITVWFALVLLAFFFLFRLRTVVRQRMCNGVGDYSQNVSHPDHHDNRPTDNFYHSHVYIFLNNFSSHCSFWDTDCDPLYCPYTLGFVCSKGLRRMARWPSPSLPAQYSPFFQPLQWCRSSTTTMTECLRSYQIPVVEQVILSAVSFRWLAQVKLVFGCWVDFLLWLHYQCGGSCSCS